MLRKAVGCQNGFRSLGEGMRDPTNALQVPVNHLVGMKIPQATDDAK